MESALNLAWAVCSVGLIWFWLRSGVADRKSRGAQVLALAMVVLLLLPVISLSDDLVAAQNPAETDSCLRRATERDHVHPSMTPIALTLPAFDFAGQWPPTAPQEYLHADSETLPTQVTGAPRYSRPPPLA